MDNRFYILGTTIDMDNPYWETAVMEKIDNAKNRGAYNDLSVMSYAILAQLYKFHARAGNKQ